MTLKRYKLIVDIIFSDTQTPERHGIIVQDDMLISTLKTKLCEAVTSFNVIPEFVHFAIVENCIFKHISAFFSFSISLFIISLFTLMDLNYYREDDRVPSEGQSRNFHAFIAKPSTKLFDTSSLSFSVFILFLSLSLSFNLINL